MSQIQALHAVAATATGSVNARGNTVAARLQDIPNRVREVAGHGVRCGAAVALATAQFQTGHDLLQVEPVHLLLGSEDWWVFEELADDMEMAAAAISEDVSIEVVIGNVFADDLISRSSIFLEIVFCCIGQIIRSAPFVNNIINEVFPFSCQFPLQFPN